MATNKTQYTQHSHIAFIPVIETQAELEAAAEHKMEYGMPTTTVGEVIPADKALIENKVKLSKMLKMKLQHPGLVPNDIKMKTEATFENGEYVAPEVRDVTKQPYAKVAPKTLTKPGTFTVTDVVDEFGGITKNVAYDASKEVWADQAADVEHPQVPPVAALNAETIALRTVKRHYRRGEVEYDPVSVDNYLDRPGIEVNTADTFIGLPEAEEVAPAALNDETSGEAEDEE